MLKKMTKLFLYGSIHFLISIANFQIVITKTNIKFLIIEDVFMSLIPHLVLLVKNYDKIKGEGRLAKILVKFVLLFIVTTFKFLDCTIFYIIRPNPERGCVQKQGKANLV